MFKSVFSPSIRALGRALLLLPFGSGIVFAAPTPQIVINGGSESLRENVRHFLPLGDEGCNTPRWRLRSLLREAQTDIARAGQALGYYRLEFDSDFEMTEDCWKVVINLKPGDPVRVNELRLIVNGEGTEDKVFQSIYDTPGIKIGDRLNHGRYETLKARFSNLAAERGYFDGYFELSQVSVNLKEDSARVELVYNTGPRYRFGEISIEQEIFDENFVRRYLNFETGDPYDSEKLLDLKNYYNASNFFALATVSPDLQQLENTQVPVNIKLDARKRRGYSLGAGIATDTGPRLLLGYEDRYVTDTGHSFAAMAHVATVKSSIEATYTIPMRRPAHEFLKFSTGFQREETDDTLSNLTRIGTNYSIYHEDSWLQVYALNYEMEDFVIADEDERRSHLIIPSVQYSRTTYDETAYPLRGWRVMGRLAGSPESLGSKVSFLQFTGHAKYIYPAFGGRFLTRLDVGATEVDETHELPVSVRYFAGGDTSVRGYSYKSIAHEDDEGRVIGGNSLLTASVEYDYLVRPKWALAVFYDIGDAPNDYNFEFKRSVGIGVRWISPIGPVRVDIACALDGVRCSSSSVEGWGLHLSMGPDL